MFTELTSTQMNEFAEGFVPLKKLFEMSNVVEAIKPKLSKLEAGEALRIEGKETMTGADLLANLAVTQHFLDKSPAFSIDAADRDITKIVAMRPVSDFKPVKIYNVTEVANFTAVKQAEDYKATAFTDDYTQIAIKKYGKILRLSWETLLSDTLGELGDLQAKLTRAGKRTIFKNISDTFVANAVFYSGAHANAGTGALNEANLTALIKKVAVQKDSLGNTLMIKARYLVVPAALEIAAKKLVNPLYGIYPASLDAMPKKFDLEVIVDPNLDDTSTTGYYVFADPADMPAISHLTLAGHQGIELLVKVSDQKSLVGALSEELGSFQNDTFEIKARFFGNDATRYYQASAYSTGV